MHPLDAELTMSVTTRRVHNGIGHVWMHQHHGGVAIEFDG
jgi:hypothetical protein